MSIIEETNSTTTDPAVVGNPVIDRIKALQAEIATAKAATKEALDSRDGWVEHHQKQLRAVEKAKGIVLEALGNDTIDPEVAQALADALGFGLTVTYTVAVDVTIKADDYEVEIELLEENVEDLVRSAIEYDYDLNGKDIEEIDFGYFSESVTIQVNLTATQSEEIEFETDEPQGSSEWEEALAEEVRDQMEIEQGVWEITDMNYEVTAASA